MSFGVIVTYNTSQSIPIDPPTDLRPSPREANMNRRLRNTLTGLSALGLFLGASLMLAQPLPFDNQHGVSGTGSESIRPNAQDSTSRNRLRLTLPYYAIGRALARSTES